MRSAKWLALSAGGRPTPGKVTNPIERRERQSGVVPIGRRFGTGPPPDTIVATVSGARRRQASDAPATTTSPKPNNAGGSSGRWSRSANPSRPNAITPSASSASQIRGSTRLKRSHQPPSTCRTVPADGAGAVILEDETAFR